jgi:hypothetical protein
MNALDVVVHRRTLLKALGGAAALVPVWSSLRGSVAFGQTDADARQDLQRLVAELDFDPQQIFRFVADQVAYDPYAGAMRGSTGTLRSLAGSSADQALLLGALLAEAQVGYRFAVGPIDDAAASSMLAGSDLDVGQATQRAATTLLSPDVHAAWGGSGPWKRAAEVDTLFAQARDRTDATVETLSAVLAAAGIELPSPVPSIPDVERERHVWLQYANGPEWVDLDPSIPGAVAGTAYATPSSTPDTLPDDLYHTITIKAIAEVVQGDQPTRTELLAQTLRVADLVGTPITITHPTAEWLGIGAAISGQQSYAPTLLAGEQVFEGSTLVLDSGGGVGGFLDQPGSVDGQALAEWLVFDLAIPGGAERHAERMVFDRLPPEQRAPGATIDLSTVAPIELVDLGDDLKSQYLPLSGFVSVAVSPAPVPWQYFDTEETGETDNLLLQAQVAHAYPYLRDLVRLESLGDRATPRFIDSEPTVTAYWTAATAPPADGLAQVAATVDIIHARHGAVPLQDADMPVPAGLLVGAMDHAAERMVLEGTFSIIPDAPTQVAFASVGRVFEVAAEEGVELVVLRPGDESAATRAPALAANRFVQDALAGGLVVIGPATLVDLGTGAGRIGWWEIDPATGLARDRLDDGFGAELGEYAMKLHHIATQALCFVSLGAAIVSVAKGATKDAMAWGAVASGACIGGFGGGH